MFLVKGVKRIKNVVKIENKVCVRCKGTGFVGCYRCGSRLQITRNGKMKTCTYCRYGKICCFLCRGFGF